MIYRYECPLDVHCSYTRDQLLLALDFMKPKTLRESVKWLPDKQTDVLLFVRETKSDACGAAPYTFLSTADYVSHTGSRPMNIVWRLHQEMPAKYLRKTQQVMG